MRLLPIGALLNLLAAATAQAAAPASAPATLERARSLLAGGDFDAAAGSAQEFLAANPGSGAAYLVLGMARFRAGRHAEALQAFEAAGQARDPPAPATLAFNQGSTLFALERFHEAERCFAAAARGDPRLAVLATLNAGLAAVQGGDLAIARAHALALAQLPGAETVAEGAAELRAALADQDAPVADEATQSLKRAARSALSAGRLDDAIRGYQATLDHARARQAPAEEEADLAYALGVALHRARRYDEAATALERAIALDPTDADFHYMAALVAHRRQRPDQARAGFEHALGLGLDDDTAAAARDRLDGLSFGLRAGGAGPGIRISGGGGYDSNVAQLGLLRSEIIGADEPGTVHGSGFAALGAEGSYGFNLSRRAFMQALYALDQIAYADPNFDEFGLQSHSLHARGEIGLPARLRVGLGILGDYQFSGLRTFSPFLGVLTAEPALAFDESALTSTSVRLRWQRKIALGQAAQAFDGSRIEIRAAQRLRWRFVRAEAAFRHRRENIGEQTITLASMGRTNQEYTANYSYRANALMAGVDVMLGPFSLGVDGFVERLRYQDDNFVAIRTAIRNQELDRKRRVDRRGGAGAQVAWFFADNFELVARYDLVANQSNVRFSFDDRNFVKHAISGELAFEW